MRSINRIIVHCTATKQGQNITVEQIRNYHVKTRGWRDIGYHYVIYIDGSIHPGRPLMQPGAHTAGYNAHSIGVCYVGGLDTKGEPADTRTPAQRSALRTLLTELRKRFPAATIHGHREFAPKACPCFDAKTEYKDL